MNPVLDPVGTGEARIAQLTAGLLEGWGLDTEIRALKRKGDDIAEALGTARRELRDLEVKVMDTKVLTEQTFACRTAGDLENLSQQLERFIDEVDGRKDNAHRALEIFERIEAEERSRVIDLFGSSKSVSRYFRDMTDGLYDAVSFDPAKGEISVRGRDGDTLPAAKLSGGAFDQLYLAIRLSVAEAVLEDSRGFFIFDDPFIKADIHRLKKQMSILTKVTRAGWQVLYFSAKKEVLDALEKEIEEGRVRLIRLEDRAAFRIPVDAPQRAAATQSDLFTDGPTY